MPLAHCDSRALLIGSGQYRHLEPVPTVPTTLRDLDTMLIDRCGMQPSQIRLVEDPENIVDFGREVADVTRSVGPDGVLLFYYVGHGLLDNLADDFYLSCNSTDPDQDYLRFSALRYEQVRQAVLSSKARARIVILDCCYAGRAVNRLGDVGDLGRLQISGTSVLAACAATELALAPESAAHTAFTGELIRYVTDGDVGAGECLDVGRIGRQVQLALWSRGGQRPSIQHSDGSERLLFARNARWRDPGLDRPSPYADPQSVGSPVRTADGQPGDSAGYPSRAESVLRELPETRWRRAYRRDDVARWVYAVDNPAWDSRALPGELASTPRFGTVLGGYRRDKVDALARTFARVSPDRLMRQDADGQPSAYSTGLLNILSQTPNARIELDADDLQMSREWCRVPESDRIVAAVPIGVKRHAGWITITDWGFRFHGTKSGLAIRHSDLNSVAISVVKSWNEMSASDYSWIYSDFCVHYRNDRLSIGGTPADVGLHEAICEALCRINCLNASIRDIACSDRRRYWTTDIDPWGHLTPIPLHEPHHEKVRPGLIKI